MLLNPIAFAESLIFRALVTSSYQHVAAFSQLQVIQRRRQAGHKCSASSFYNTVVPQCSTVFTDPLPSKDKFKTWTLNSSNWWSSWGSRSTGIMEIKSCAVLVYNYCLYHYSSSLPFVTSAAMALSYLWTGTGVKYQPWQTSAPWQRHHAGRLLVYTKSGCGAGKMQGIKKLFGTWLSGRASRKFLLLPSLRSLLGCLPAWYFHR